jgi:membrane glycosyltransferase
MANGERTTEVLVSTAVLLVIPCLFVVLSCYARACIVKALGWDDAAIILAMVSVFSHCLSHVKLSTHTNFLASGILYNIRSLCVFEATSHGYGQTMAMLTLEQRVTIKRV